MIENNLVYGYHPYGNQILSLPRSLKGVRPFSKNNAIGQSNNQYKGMTNNLDSVNPSYQLLYWFRWTLGHHISFLCWIFISKYLCENISSDDSQKIASNVSHCKAMLSLMSCMYIYTTTAPSETYHSGIRNFMELYCSGFSATWARDYSTLKNAIQQYANTTNLVLESSTIIRLFEKSKMVHLAVAKKLVKGKKSLRQQYKNSTRNFCISECHKIYDNFFLVERVNSVSENTLMRSLIKRLCAVLFDVKQNALLNTDDPDAIILIHNKATRGFVENFQEIIQLNIDICVNKC